MNVIRSLLIAAAAAVLAAPPAAAQTAPKLKVGLMLPASGTYAALGTAIENGFKLYVAEQGGKLAGREVEFAQVDDESDPAKATDNVNKLLKRDSVDVLVGSVHSGVAMAMAKVAKDTGTPLIVPNAGAAAVTGSMCAPNIFRSSFSNWQPGYAMGEVVAAKGHKNVVTITWHYAAGLTAVKGDLTRKPEFDSAIENAKIDSPRGAFTLSRSHNPVQDIYLRQVVGKENKLVGVASKALADPGQGCSL